MQIKNIFIYIIIPVFIMVFSHCNRSEMLKTIEKIIEESSTSSEKDITEFQFLASDNPAYLLTDVVSTIDQTNGTIELTAPYNTDVTDLIATYTLSGGEADILGTIQTSGTTSNNFTNPVTYTITASDSTLKDYTVTVNIALNSAKELTKLNFLASDNASLSTDVIGSIDQVAKTINLTVPYSATTNALIADFATTGSEVRISAVIQYPRSTVNDYSTTVTYTVEAADGSTADYTITVTKLPASSNKALTEFAFLTTNNPGLSNNVFGEINDATKSVIVYLTYGTTVTSLKSSFTISGTEAKVVGVSQTSDVTTNDFSSTVYYTIIAEDASTTDYSVDIFFCYIRDKFEVDLSQWEINSSNSYTYQGLASPGADGSDYSLEQTGQIYNHTYNFTKTIGPTQINYMSFYIKFTDLTGSRGYVTLRDVSSNYVVFFIGSGSNFGVHDGYVFYGGKPITVDQWYFIEFKNFNWTAKTHDYYCDGVLMYSAAPFRDPISSEVTKVNFYNWDASTVYIDEVLIY